MSRSLTVLFRRDPSRDKQRQRIRYLGFRCFWPDGRPVTVGLDAFCQQGQRFLGLNRLLARQNECLLRLILFPVYDSEANINRLPGHRVRRFILERKGPIGRLHFMDGTPTDVVFHLKEDEHKVLDWTGLSQLADGERQWIDLAASPVEEMEEKRLNGAIPVEALRANEIIEHVAI